MEIHTLIFGSLILLTNLWTDRDRAEDLTKYLSDGGSNYNLPQIETYDFIIAGGGLAGSVLAAKLSEYYDYKILVLEIGGNPPPTVYPPANQFPYLFANDNISFNFQSEYHENAGGETNGTLTCHVGKVLGGSSITNGLVYHRGSPFDYDNWANITKDESWSWENLLPIFRRVEKYEGEYPPGETHGSEGPLVISKQNFAPGVQLYMDAAKELGYEIADPNGPQIESFSPIEFNTKNGKRHSVYDAYLKPVLDRTNLRIERYAEVERIILSEDNKVAIGVEWKKHGFSQNIAYASKEVILSAGAFGSPKILLKSGIGPRQHLEDMQIPVKVELPVGKSFQDHPGISIQAFVNTTDPEILFFPERDYTLESLVEFEEKGDGPMTFSSYGAIGVGFTASHRAKNEGYPDWPDLQFSLQSQPDGGKLDDESTHIISIFIFVGRIKSRGYLRLNKLDPDLQPEFGFNYFTGPDAESDIDVLIEGIKIAIDLFENTQAYARIGARVKREITRGCEGLEWGTDPYWTCYIKMKSSGNLHPVGTCPMGSSLEDPIAVVDSKLRVFGVENLRVIDASVMPEMTNSNTQAPTLVIAEKGADEILDQWGRPDGNGSQKIQIFSNFVFILAFAQILINYNV